MTYEQEFMERNAGAQLDIDRDKVWAHQEPISNALHDLLEAAPLPSLPSPLAISVAMMITAGLMRKAAAAFLETRPNHPHQDGLLFALGFVTPEHFEFDDLTAASELAKSFPVEYFSIGAEIGVEIFLKIESLISERSGELQGDNLGALYCQLVKGFLEPLGESLTMLRVGGCDSSQEGHSVAILLLQRRIFMVN